MKIQKYHEEDLDITFLFEFASDVIYSLFPLNIWVSIGRVMIKASGLIVKHALKEIKINVRESREYYLVELKTSNARIKAASLIAVTAVYNESIKSIVSDSYAPGLLEINKQKLLKSLNSALDKELNDIIEWCP